LNHFEHAQDIRSEPIKPGEQGPVATAKPRRLRGIAAKDIQLMAKGQIFRVQLTARPKTVAQSPEQQSYELNHRFRSSSDSIGHCESQPDEVFGRDTLRWRDWAAVKSFVSHRRKLRIPGPDA
jgi:hypothetical protein